MKLVEVAAEFEHPLEFVVIRKLLANSEKVLVSDNELVDGLEELDDCYFSPPDSYTFVLYNSRLASTRQIIYSPKAMEDADIRKHLGKWIVSFK